MGNRWATAVRVLPKDVPLNLYRRHFRIPGKCSGAHTPDSRNYESDELRRGWKRCLCPIYADGTLNGSFKRRNTKAVVWDEAKAVAGSWESMGRWDAPQQVAPAQEVSSKPEPEPQGTLIETAIAAFLQEHESASAPNTVKKYRLLMGKLASFAASRGYLRLHQIRPLDVREFQQSWGVSPLTASKHLGIIRSFFQYALISEWIDRNPAALVRRQRRQATDAKAPERLPFSDAELERMLAACHTRYGKDHAYRYSWSGSDLEDFIFVSVYTGLRISDVSTFHISRLLPSGECHVRTTKNGRKVYTWVPEWLQDRIQERARRYGPEIFGAHETKDMNVITDVWRRKLKRLWKLCGPWSEAPTPHRFRHTFARILLERSGVTVRDVAELLGDTEKMVLRHYAAWVPERQTRLTSVLREAFQEKSHLPPSTNREEEGATTHAR